MKKAHRSRSPDQLSKRKDGRRFRKEPRLILFLVLGCLGIAGLVKPLYHGFTKRNTTEAYLSRAPFAITFTKDVAPIVFKHCASCHRPGQSSPFSLLSYAEVRKHASQIAEVTQKRYMPPWLPEPGYGEFANTCRLSATEIGLLHQWVTEGAIEGIPSDLPPIPQWKSEWALGEPDLVLEMPKSYSLSAEGKDVYRNFVIPVPLSGRRYVKAVEFRPGNPKIVHHVFIKVDRTGQARKLEGRDGQPGFAGMVFPEGVQAPEGHFLTWQPGKLPAFEPEGLSWSLEQNCDLVLQVHMRPSGKPEVLQSRLGLYFTDTPPTWSCSKLELVSLTLDIPPGQQNYLVKDDFVLPTDVEMLAVLPHAHYLCKRMEGFATLPDGSRKWLLLITNWDFNWQGDYRYSTPVTLPRGTALSMRYFYDNSTNNIQNPNNPPKRVSYGPQSSDEMAELWFQLRVIDREKTNAFAQASVMRMRAIFADYDEYLLRADPRNTAAHLELGGIRSAEGRREEAERHYRAAIEMDALNDTPHYLLGVMLRSQKRFSEAKVEFETALRLNPNNCDAHGNLGVIFAQEGMLVLAESHLRSALRIKPDDLVAKGLLEELLRAEGRLH